MRKAPCCTWLSILWAFFALFSIKDCHALGSQFFVDDNYTVSKRFVKYKQSHPQISIPIMSFLAGQRVSYDIAYASINGRELHLDVFFNATKEPSKGLIVLIHGGGWRSGNKSHFYPLANLLAQQGYDVATPEYRLSIEARYPAAIEDIEKAIDFLTEKSDSFGFNKSKLILGGGSSGGHLASLIALNRNKRVMAGKHQVQLPVHALINMDGLLSTTNSLALSFENKQGDSSALAMWLGGRYESQAALWQRVSPEAHLSKYAPEMLVVSSSQPRFTAGLTKATTFYQQHKIRYQVIQLANSMHTYWLFEPYLSVLSQTIVKFLQPVK